MILGVLCGMGFTTPAPAQNVAVEYPDPARYEDAVRAFEVQDSDAPPQAGAVLCIGSSSMLGWHDTIRRDLVPLTVIPRGFGGSTMYDLVHFTDRIVIPYKPRAILVYEGDNDIALGISPEVVRDIFRVFVAKVHAALPETRIYMIAIKPSISRFAIWPEMVRANGLLIDECAENELLTYIDIAAPMLNADGRPKPEIFVDDELHMNAGGYSIWRDTIGPVLTGAEARYELSQ